MKPPKCRTCGAEEWRHTCGNLPKIRIPSREFLVAHGETMLIDGIPHEVVLDDALAVTISPALEPVIVTEPKHGRGRPRVHASGAERVRAHRARKATKS